MVESIIRGLDSQLVCKGYHIKDKQIIFYISSGRKMVGCPFCGKLSSRVHSYYQREIQDLPIQDRQTVLLLDTRKMLCQNPECSHTTFSERFDFVADNGKKTRRLAETILMVSAKASSVSTSKILGKDAVRVSKSSICDMLKKIPAIVDKPHATKVCIDDFAFRKRYSYGTVMVDLESHRIIDILASWEPKEVAGWLRSFPNLEVVSRDGSQAYASAVAASHPKAMQVSDRFHLLKNLSEAVGTYIMKTFPTKLEIPATALPLSGEMMALYDTRNRAQRIRFARKKREEGRTITDIALLLHASTKTVSKYLAMDEGDIPEDRGTSRERMHQEELMRKQAAIDEVRGYYAQGKSIYAISKLTGHTAATVKRYLDKGCPLQRGAYNGRIPGKLAPYEKEVVELRSQGIPYTKIHETIKDKGYTGSVVSLRMFMQKKRVRVQEALAGPLNGEVEYIPRKSLCQLAYKELEDVGTMTQGQYDGIVKKYPIIGKLYHLLREFHRIVFSQKGAELDSWIGIAEQLEIEEINTYINGLQQDIGAVKNGIDYKFNNGLAKGSVNKIKLAKRIMYGRHSFELLRSKLLLNEYYF